MADTNGMHTVSIVDEVCLYEEVRLSWLLVQHDHVCTYVYA